MADLKLGSAVGGYLVLHTNNFNIYSPTLVGTGASGTWSISVSGSAGSVVSNFIVKVDTGVTEGTDLYTFNGATAKTLDFKSGTNVTLTDAAGSVTFSSPSLSLGSTVGAGNAVTDVAVSGHQVTMTKGSTFLTSETSLTKVDGTGDYMIDISVSGHVITETKDSFRTAGSTSAGALKYSGTTATTGQFDGGTTTPTGATRLNYGGYFYPTRLNLVGEADTATVATQYFVEIGSDGIVRPKTLANVIAEIVTATDILTKIKTVDGAGSGLDADTLDTYSSASFAGSELGVTSDLHLVGAGPSGYNTFFQAALNASNGPVATAWINGIQLASAQNNTYRHLLVNDSVDWWFQDQANGVWGTWKKLWNNANLTNLNQLTNGPGYASGTVTSVATTAPISGGTITTTGTISLAAAYGDTLNPYASKTAKYFLAAPNAAAGIPDFRAIVASDIPTLNQATSGQAGSVANSHIIKLNTGAVENTSLYTYNGSVAKTLDFKDGTNVTITAAAGTATFSSPSLSLVEGTGDYITDVQVSGHAVTEVKSIFRTAGDTSTGALKYAGTIATSGQLDGGATTPSGTTRLNYGGYFYPTRLNLIGEADTATAATHYYTEIGSDGIVRPKTLANVKTELVTSAAVIAGLGLTPASDSSVVHIALTETITGAKTFNAGLTIGPSQQLIHNGTSTRDKIRVWTSDPFNIGMGSSYTFGPLINEYAMTFQMSNDIGRGWWWGTASHTNAQGVMALNTSGIMTLASGARIGYGTSDTTVPDSSTLDVKGGIKTSDGTNSGTMIYNTTEQSIDFIIN